ncbi:hypothetical protein [Tateyamaria sp. ANG-S1]|uniref:hypothetical protein n=1 Tax=Tateyamaria sp. ANG-S1 TaxID=1577905 RepID=UPI00126A3B2B|nr:hypothetical protein [Tateyamaria sp. ANG-S1]
MTMYVISFAALGLGIATGWSMASRFMLRRMVGVFLLLVAAVVWVGMSPDSLPGDGFAVVVATYLVGLPMAAGMVGGAIMSWLFRRSRAAS